MQMINKFFFAVFVMALALFGRAAPAGAQLCQAIPNLIFEIAEPEIGAYNLWDTFYGEPDAQEVFVDGLLFGRRRLVLLGQKSASGEAAPAALIVKLDHRGRELWVKEHPIDGLIRVEKMLRSGDGFVVIATVRNPETRRRSVWFGTFDQDGALVSQNMIAEKNAHVSGQDIIRVPGEEAFLVAVSVDLADVASHAQIYKVDSSGRILTERSLVPGPENAVLSLAVVEGGHFAASGYIYGEDGRKNGWVFSLDNRLAIDWERQYPRGFSAHLSSVQGFSDNYIVVMGQAQPAGRGRKAAWVMMLSKERGDVEWQRYYRAEHYNQEAAALVENKDGLMSVVVNAKVSEGAPEDITDFVRLLTINKRGVLFETQDHMNSEGVEAYGIFNGDNHQRVVIGRSLVKDLVQDNQGELISTSRSYQGWVMNVPGLEAYDDPCDRLYYYNP